MKKVTILLFSLIIFVAIILFFYFKNKPIQIENKQKTKIIQESKTVEKKEKPKETKEPELKLILEPTQNYDKSRYEKVEDYKEAVPLGETLKNTKQKDLDINVDVDVNKEEKSIDGVELNIQKKF